MERIDPIRGQKIASDDLDVGKLFVDTKKIYLDARAKSAELGEPRMRFDAMFVIVELLGNLIREVGILRDQITRGEQGLAGFDADLAGLRQRYRNLYKPVFEDDPAVEEWTDEDWLSFEELLEGPILTWDLKTCQERWGIPFGSPPCEGPDLHMALSLLHQTGVASKFQQELVASFYGVANLTMQDVYDTYTGLARAAGKGIAGAFGAIAEGITNYVVPPKVAKGFGLGLGIAAAIGVGGYLWMKKNKKGN